MSTKPEFENAEEREISRGGKATAMWTMGLAIVVENAAPRARSSPTSCASSISKRSARQPLIDPSLAVARSRAKSGIQAPEVRVEVYLGGGLPRLNIVGLPEAAVREGPRD